MVSFKILTIHVKLIKTNAMIKLYISICKDLMYIYIYIFIYKKLNVYLYIKSFLLISYSFVFFI